MSARARDDELRIHGVHPSQNKKTPAQNGTTMRMPGGREGVKK